MLQYQTHSPDEAYQAFNELYARYSGRVYSYCMKKTKNVSESEDLMQKVFLKIHDSKHLYKPQFKFEQWLFVIARSQTLDFCRAKSRYEARLGKVEMPSANERNDSDGSNKQVQLDLLDLDRDQRELLEMKYVDELSYQEISKILSKSEVSLRKTVSRLLTKLKLGEV